VRLDILAGRLRKCWIDCQFGKYVAREGHTAHRDANHPEQRLHHGGPHKPLRNWGRRADEAGFDHQAGIESDGLD